ncbi:hypothetical protein [Hansschlegelia zhihuaiae]|uniref:Uncharacterized protein n=1 Tax=Hansschlegelia zhihuaiae TaxID=405005 RepID=A0A4Q0MKQ4_9HYPH|nr:hypothetical protein [Hansschlegelia zhihuaiae]RXF74281.1 hypothetical protein EK403_05485 [Hansschlegelia zhihuaiae]
MTAFAVLLALLSAGAALAAILRAGRREAALRRSALADCEGLLDGVVRKIAPSGYGELRGRFGGLSARLVPISEALVFRRLPQLWIAADVARPAADGRAVEIVRRPTGTEFFTGAGALPLAYTPPPHWPQDTAVRGSGDASSLLAELGPLLAEPLSDPKLKSVAVTPRGVRVVRQAAQGERASYLLFRESRFAKRISVSDAEAALELAAAIALRLAAQNSDARKSDAQEPDAQDDVRAA